MGTEHLLNTGEGEFFSSRLRELRRAKAISLRKLACEVGVTASAVCNWENNLARPRRGRMIQLSKFFDVELAWLEWGIGARCHRLESTDLLVRFEQCDETQRRAIGALLDAFDV